MQTLQVLRVSPKQLPVRHCAAVGGRLIRASGDVSEYMCVLYGSRPHKDAPSAANKSVDVDLSTVARTSCAGAISNTLRYSAAGARGPVTSKRLIAVQQCGFDSRPRAQQQNSRVGDTDWRRVAEEPTHSAVLRRSTANPVSREKLYSRFDSCPTLDAIDHRHCDDCGELYHRCRCTVPISLAIADPRSRQVTTCRCGAPLPLCRLYCDRCLGSSPQASACDPSGRWPSAPRFLRARG